MSSGNAENCGSGTEGLPILLGHEGPCSQSGAVEDGDLPAFHADEAGVAVAPEAEAVPVSEPVVVPDDDDTRVVVSAPETSAAGEPEAPGGNGDKVEPERVVVGDDDLLADVDTGVNEDEFKW